MEVGDASHLPAILEAYYTSELGEVEREGKTSGAFYKLRVVAYVHSCSAYSVSCVAKLRR